MFRIRILTQKKLHEINDRHYFEGMKEGIDTGIEHGIVSVVKAKLPDGYLSEETNKFYTGVGQVIRAVHAKSEKCDEYGCVIHNPTNHSMRKLPTLWRGDRGLMERICVHGVGHPDPDDIAFKRRLSGDSFADGESAHGCDGCCYRE